MRYNFFSTPLSILYVLLALLYGCQNNIDVNYIESTGWLADSGFKITQYMDFRHYYSIKGDTIYFENKPKCIIIGLDKSNSELTVKSIKDNEIGTYFDERVMINGN